MINKAAFLIIIMIAGCLRAECQMWGDSAIIHQPLFYSVETAPRFQGGMQGYYEFLAQNLHIPDNKFSISSGRIVTARIVIDTIGKIVFAEIEKGVNENYNNAVLELLKKMPDWSPGLQNGHAVPTSMQIPVLFVD